MGTSFRGLIVMLLCTTLAACTTMREVPKWQPTETSSRPNLSPDLEPGDRITVTTVDGEEIAMIFVALTSDAIEGTVGKDEKAVRVPRARVSRVERREISAFKTTGLVISVLAVAFVALLVVGLALYVPPLP